MMRSERQQQQLHQDQRIFYVLSALVLNLLRSPPTPISFTDQPMAVAVASASDSTRRRSRSRERQQQISPAGFASLMLGISLALMLCGSVTFFIGFMLMPWVLGLIMVFYVAGIVSTISMLGRSLFCYARAPSPSCPRKDIPAWKLL